MPRYKTHEEYCAELLDINSDYKPVDTYLGSSTSIRHACKLCGHIRITSPSNMLSHPRCLECMQYENETIIGKKYGMLTVVDKATSPYGHSGLRVSCLCDCGKIIIVLLSEIKSGRMRHCGDHTVELQRETKRKKAIQYVGQKFSMLTIIRLSETSDSKGRTLVDCKCDCGNIMTASLTALKMGAIKSCGCYNKKMTSERRLIDETGKHYGHITVLGRDNNNTSGGVMWKCLCSLCGKEFSAYSGRIRKRTSCPDCSYKQSAVKKRKVFNGDIFGRLTVLNYDEEKSAINHRATYVCLCECGEYKSVEGYQLTTGNVKSCGCLAFSYDQLKRHSASMRGIQLEEWEGFAYESIHVRFRRSPEYAAWRNAVCKRDNWVCVKCGTRTSRFNPPHAHHLNSYADYPEQRLDINNGVTLCSRCHATMYKGSFHNMYGTQHNTHAQFDEWMNLSSEIKENT